MKLISSDFEKEGKIPTKFTCDGENINPNLQISEVPENAVSLVLIMDDPDVPAAVREEKMFDHWVVFNIDPSINEIKENSLPGIRGSNTRGEKVYTGPCPPPQYEPKEHRYFFKLYALDVTLNLDAGATKAEVEAAMQDHILAEAKLMGRYERG